VEWGVPGHRWLSAARPVHFNPREIVRRVVAQRKAEQLEDFGDGTTNAKRLNTTLGGHSRAAPRPSLPLAPPALGATALPLKKAAVGGCCHSKKRNPMRSNFQSFLTAFFEMILLKTLILSQSFHELYHSFGGQPFRLKPCLECCILIRARGFV